jgi:hypothetical protein
MFSNALQRTLDLAMLDQVFLVISVGVLLLICISLLLALDAIRLRLLNEKKAATLGAP